MNEENSDVSKLIARKPIIVLKKSRTRAFALLGSFSFKKNINRQQFSECFFFFSLCKFVLLLCIDFVLCSFDVLKMKQSTKDMINNNKII